MHPDAVLPPLGIPAICTTHRGIDSLGARCRVDPSVSVMRWGEREVVHLEDEVSIYANTRIVLGDVTATPEVGLRIGARTIVNVGCYLSGEGGLDIGPDVLIGAHVRLLSAGHAIDEGSAIVACNRITRAPIRVEEGAWIGAAAIVLEGVTIGRGAVVAAGAVVRSNVPAGMIAAGVPARMIRRRRLPEFLPRLDLDPNAPTAVSLTRRAKQWLARMWLHRTRDTGRPG